MNELRLVFMFSSVAITIIKSHVCKNYIIIYNTYLWPHLVTYCTHTHLNHSCQHACIMCVSYILGRISTMIPHASHMYQENT